MTDGNTYFASCIRHEQSKLRERIEWESKAEWPQPSLVKEVRRHFSKHPALNGDIGGVAGAVDSFRSAARGDPHAERVRKLIVRHMCVEDSDEVAARRVLRAMLEEQAANDKSWSRMPIRVYGPDAALAPCVDGDGILHTRKDHPGEAWATFDAAWLWKDYCVYGWHRWAQTSVDMPEVARMVSRCARTESSLYQDKPALFVMMIHGAAWENVQSPVPHSENIIFAAPWEIAAALSDYK